MKNFIEKFLKKIFEKDPNKKSFDLDAAVALDAREHERFALCQKEGIHCLIQDKIFSVGNISYGGVGLIFDNPFDEKIFKESEEAVIFFFDKNIKTKIKCVYLKEPIAGMSFIDLSIDDIWFLKNACKYLKQGSSLNEIKKSHLKDSYKTQQWRCFRGEGPSDLLLKISDHQPHKIEEFLLTFLAHGYCELSYKNGVFKTGKSIDEEGIGARMATTNTFEKEIARSGALILKGLTNKELIEFFAPIDSLLVDRMRE